MWEAIDIKDWKDVPCLSGEIATEDDVLNGKAVFFIPSGSEVYDVELPLCAIHKDLKTGERTPCIAIQIELADNGVFIGVRYLTGGNGIGSVDEFELFTEPTEEFGL